MKLSIYVAHHKYYQGQELGKWRCLNLGSFNFLMGIFQDIRA